MKYLKHELQFREKTNSNNNKNLPVARTIRIREKLTALKFGEDHSAS